MASRLANLWTSLPAARRAVLASGFVLVLTWTGLVFPRLADGQNAIVRMGLSVYFSMFILFRRKHAADEELTIPVGATGLAAAAGVAAVILGHALSVHQVEWIGVILVLFACFHWSLPASYAADIPRSLFLLYWAHPLPGQVFGALQIGMQTASTRGAEWLLQLFNVRVWADGLILRTGYATFEVPAWCSGMRTAATVFLLGLGMSMLKRFRRAETLILVFFALAQALALNVLRITMMVALAPSLGEAAGMAFLHDSTGIVVLLGAVILCAEIALWERVKRHRAARRREPDLELFRRLSEMPPLWRALIRARWVVATVVVLSLLVAGLAYRSRAEHRMEMLRGVVGGLRETGQLEAAHRAAEIVLSMKPDDYDWRMTIVRLMLARGLHERLLAELNTIPDGDEYRLTEKNIIRAYALMSLDKLDEAGEIVRDLPSRVRDEDPRAAMILAQMGRHADDPDEVERNVRTASRWTPNVVRIRDLYPYLRQHRKWNAIAESDRKLPYTNPMQAFAATEAHMNLNNATDVSMLALNAMRAWPDDPRALEPLFYMAMKRDDVEWGNRFAAHLVRTTENITDPDTLAGLVTKCFHLARPDLAWFLYRRIAEIDSSHPFLALMPARHGAEWFSFRKQRLGISSPGRTDKIDVRPFWLAGRMFDSWQPLCDTVPHGAPLCTSSQGPARREFLRTALLEFKERSAAGTLSLPTQYEYVWALEMEGDIEGVEKQLTTIAKAYPEERERVRIVLSEVHERRRDWSKVYETLRDYQNVDDPQLMPMVRLVHACSNLRLSLAAMYISRECERLFPGSSHAATARAGSLMQFGAPEEALFVLDRPRPRHQREMDILEAEALLDTRRLAEMRTFCQAALLPRIPIPPDIEQRLFLPAAELSAVWHMALVIGDDEIAANTEAARRTMESVDSPFLRRMLRQWIDCYEAGCGGDTAAIDAWTACGRDRIEKATALSQLAILLCWQQRFIEARNAVGVAARLFPESPALWRMLISLSAGDSEVVAMARLHCPDDPEIWLAELVLRTQQKRPASVYGGLPVESETTIWATEEIARATYDGSFPAETVTRAGEYLLRGGMKRPARIAAEYAVARARGLLPAYVLGIRCALAEGDRQWALQCTRRAIDASIQPSPLIYQKLVSLKTVDGDVALDAEMVEALKALSRGDPDNPLWSQMLGYVRFKRGGLEMIDAMRHMMAAIEHGATNRTPYIVAAEASRLRGSPRQAVDLLRSGLRRFPNDLEILNNLAYALAATPRGAEDALQYIPELMKRGGDDPRVLDTAAVVYLRSGKMEQAGEILARIIEKAGHGSRRWFVTRTREAEIALRRGDYAMSVSILQEAFGEAGRIPDDDLLAANELLAKAETLRIKQDATATNAPTGEDR